uniref:Uncharacterized protein n=1 Tax=Rhizophora mucronata TaxID=61149 RepID=A0A2P2QVW0_RHIMU
MRFFDFFISYSNKQIAFVDLWGCLISYLSFCRAIQVLSTYKFI